MKYLALLIFSLCFIACNDKLPADIINNVNKTSKEINDKLKDYTLKTVDDITQAGGGTINGYYKDEEVKKVIAEQYADTCRTFTEYYFDDGMLIYAREQNFIYNKPISYTEQVARERGDSVWYDDKLTRLETSKYYFNENNMIRWVDTDGSDVRAQLPEFTDKQSEIWARAVLLLKQLKEAE